jgi:hypothetical protein
VWNDELVFVHAWLICDSKSNLLLYCHPFSATYLDTEARPVRPSPINSTLSMPSSTKKRQREPEDWDHADLSRPDPMYKKTAPTCIPASSSTTFRVNTTAKGPDPYLMSYNSTFDSKAPYSYSYTPAATTAPVMTMPSAPYSSYNYNYPYPQPSQPQLQPQPQVQAAVPPSAKKQRKKKKDPNEPPSEKRGAMFKKKCPQNILDRVDRVMSQR